MALTRAQFVTQFPEFAQTDTSLVDAELSKAEARMSTTVWGDLFDEGHGNLTADALASKGYGSKEVGKDGLTAYRRAYNDLEERVGLVHLAVV